MCVCGNECTFMRVTGLQQGSSTPVLPKLKLDAAKAKEDPADKEARRVMLQ